MIRNLPTGDWPQWQLRPFHRILSPFFGKDQSSYVRSKIAPIETPIASQFCCDRVAVPCLKTSENVQKHFTRICF